VTALSGEGGLPQLGPLPLVGVPAGEPGVRALAAVVTCVVLTGGAVAGGVLAFARDVLARRAAAAAGLPGEPAATPGKSAALPGKP
jgi:hypothetical protein